MKCPSCGAELKTDQVKEIRFCPYCGKEVKIPEEVPTTIAGAIHGIAKTYMNQQAEKERYEREHAEEIARQKKEEQKEKNRQMIRYIFMMLLVPALILIGIHFGFLK